MASASVRAGKRLPRAFYRRDPREVAPELLNKVLVVGGRPPRAHRGDRGVLRRRSTRPRTPIAGRRARNAVMFGPPGHVVCVLHLRHALLLQRRLRRGRRGRRPCCCAPPNRSRASTACAPSRPAAKRDRDLCSGPGAPVPGVRHRHVRRDGADLVSGAGEGMSDRRRRRAAAGRSLSSGSRVGIRHAAEELWRWYVPGNPNVSKR